MRALLLAAALITAPALAQETAPAPIDPARLAAAHALVDQVMPPDRRDAMVEGMIRPMMANMRSVMLQQAELQSKLDKDPRVRDLFTHFMDKVMAESMATARAGMPHMMDATATAYARQFTTVQLGEVRAFYQTPTGHMFMEKMPSLMADPAIVAAQREMMAAEMQRIPALVSEFSADLQKLQPEKKP